MKQIDQILKNKKCLVFLDLEGTQFSHEMIEIGAYKCTLKSDGHFKKIMPGFKSYVRAKEHIGHFVTELTGITEQKLKEEGLPLRVVLQSFKEYVGRDWEKTLFVTFGSHDKKIISESIMHNLDADKNLTSHMIHSNWDFSDWLSRYIRDANGNTYSLTNFLKRFGVEFEGKAHDALVDAYNLAMLYQAVLDHPDILSQEFKSTLVLKNSHYPLPIRNLIAKLNRGESVTPEDFDAEIKDFLS